MAQQDCGCKAGTKPDRYVSFKDIDCDGRARLLMEAIDKHLQDPAKNNAFWDYFNKKRRGSSGPRPDDLFLIHSNINQIREFFESCQDAEGQALLAQIEEECC
jgi:N(2)-fixation sustaining protein CowN